MNENTEGHALKRSHLNVSIYPWIMTPEILEKILQTVEQDNEQFGTLKLKVFLNKNSSSNIWNLYSKPSYICGTCIQSTKKQWLIEVNFRLAWNQYYNTFIVLGLVWDSSSKTKRTHARKRRHLMRLLRNGLTDNLWNDSLPLGGIKGCCLRSFTSWGATSGYRSYSHRTLWVKYWSLCRGLRWLRIDSIPRTFNTK